MFPSSSEMVLDGITSFSSGVHHSEIILICTTAVTEYRLIVSLCTVLICNERHLCQHPVEGIEMKT